MILVAKCRAGHICRFHGRLVESPSLMVELRTTPHVLVCPEMAAGLPCPRPPICVRDGHYLLDGTMDITDRLLEACEVAAARHADKDIFIGVSGSPTCDPKNGLFAATLAEHGVKTRLSLPVRR